MAEKELRKMGRGELVEIIYALQQEENKLQEDNAALQARLADKTIRLEKAGSIAEAALALNQVFEAAQKAADAYLASARQKDAEAQSRADALLAAAQQKADALLAQTQADCEAKQAKAAQETEAQWQRFREKVSKAMALSPELEALLKSK